MTSATSAAGTTTYQLNALGQRFRKTSSSSDVVFVYDVKGKLIAEASPSGSTTREYIYLRDTPVAVISAGDMKYIHTDHLDTPRAIYDASQQIRWSWDQQEPFGVNAPDENPMGQGAFEFSARFPGQYADKETNLAYNLTRDYDPSLARYLQSDRIGLQGGLNTYAYAAGDPVLKTDPNGENVILFLWKLFQEMRDWVQRDLNKNLKDEYRKDKEKDKDKDDTDKDDKEAKLFCP